MITIEAGGLLKARNIAITTTVAKVDKKGTLSATGQGLLDGKGAGTGRAGGGFGGRGGNGDTAGMIFFFHFFAFLCPNHILGEGI